MTPSVRSDNRFRFLCSVVGREERYLTCVLRRHRKWRGESVDCGGCSAAMDANKCPAIHMIDLETPRNETPKAIFFDKEGTKLYAVPKAVAERIEKVAILPSHCRGKVMTAEMRERLTGQSDETTKDAPALAALPRLAAEPAALKPGSAIKRRGIVKSTKAEGDMSDVLDNAEVDIAAAISAAV